MLALATELPPQRPECAPPVDYWPADADERKSLTWFVLHTKSNLEWRLATDLARAGLDYFLPQCEKVTRTADRKRTVSILPLFKNYCFLRGDEHAPSKALGTFKLRNVIRVSNQAKLRGDLANLELAIGMNPRIESCEEIVKGTRVRVTTGPFEGLEGKMLERGKDTLMVIEVEGCGRAVLEIDRSKLEPF